MDEKNHRVPPLSPAAREAGLAKARQARRERGEMKRRMKAGEVSPADVLADEAMGGMRVYEFLVAVPRIGQARALSIMREHSIGETRRLRGLGARQRAGIIADIEEILSI